MKKIIIAAIAVGVVGLGAGHMFAAPGDENDPVVTLSYLESVLLPSLSQQIEQKTAPQFNVIEVEKGMSVICEAGTELILRKGAATIISTEKGGLANVTLGVDLMNGMPVPSNSLLIVPLSDGRGVMADDNLILMIKGVYTIK